MAERNGYRAKSSRAIALKSKWEQMCQRLVRMGAVCRMWRGAYVVSLPDMVAVVMRVMGRWEGVRSGRAKSCCVVVYSQSVGSQSLGERSGLASRGRNEGGSWLPRKGAKPKAQLNGGHKSCLVVSTSRSRPSTHREGEAELSPNDNITAAREQLAREPTPSAKRVVALVVDL